MKWISLIVSAATASACGGNARPRPVALANQASSPAAPRVSLAGTYTQPHPVLVVCDSNPDGWCEEQASDTLTIREARDGAIAVTIELFQANAHMCNFEGELRPAPPPAANTRRWRFQEQNDDGPCEFVLDRTEKELTLQSEGCRYYCGARASLDATFPVSPGP